MPQRTLEDLRLELHELRRLNAVDAQGPRRSLSELLQMFDELLRDAPGASSVSGPSAFVGDRRAANGAADAQGTGHATDLLRLHLELQSALLHSNGAPPASESLLGKLGQALEAAACEYWGAPSAGALEQCEQQWRGPLHAPGGAEGVRHAEASGERGAPLSDSCEFVEWIENLDVDSRVDHDEWMRRDGLRTLLRVPVRTAEAQFGSLRLYWRERRQRDAAVAELAACFGELLAQRLQERRAREQGRSRDESWRALARVTFDAVVAVDRLGRIVELNRAAESLLGRERGAVLGRPLVELAVPERLRKRAAQSFDEFAVSAEPSSDCRRFGGTVLRASGEELAVDVAIAAFDPRIEDVFVLCARTALRRAEDVAGADKTRAQLRSLMTELLIAEERERRRLAQDLHDGLSQTLALAQIKLSSVRSTGRFRSAETLEALEELHGLITSADRSARSIGFELSPPSLHQLGLSPALLWLVETLHVRYGIAIEFDDGGHVRPMDEPRRVVVFRAIRELLINAAKHSGASQVRLKLRETTDGLLVCVEDEGVGMIENGDGRVGTGLLSIRERLAHIGGTLRIRSAPGRGTGIELEIPWSGDARERIENP
jgi:PAS domain S-box-containing protein